jgi:L-lactate dehydrogenase complex protein LldE
MRIALFITCLADTLYPDVGKATVGLLERLGHEVIFPRAQTCCGQMHINTGYQRDGLALVRHYVDTFEGCEVIVAPSASCVGSVRHQHSMVARQFGDEKLAQRAAYACAAADSSCLMHIGGGLSRLSAGVATVHLAEVLASTRDWRTR